MADIVWLCGCWRNMRTLDGELCVEHVGTGYYGGYEPGAPYPFPWREGKRG